MARNQEKAQSMLNRWRSMKKDENMKLNQSIREQYERLPRRPNDATSVPECERARMSLLRHIGQRVMEIQNGKIQFCCCDILFFEIFNFGFWIQ